VALVFLACVLAGAWLPARLAVATSGSLDHRVFFLLSPPAHIERGEHLVFRHRDLTQVQPGLRSGHDRMIKQVGCLPGEHLTRDEANRFSCNGRPLGQALAADSKGQPLPRFSWNGPVPAGKLFMIGTHPRSYDSKYYGFIDVHEILYQALPLW
jgi:type IV secretory pathway protease TraF